MQFFRLGNQLISQIYIKHGQVLRFVATARFVTCRQTDITPSNIAVSTACQRDGLSTGITQVADSALPWHKLRHTFVSRVLNEGCDLFVVKELCGHEDIKSTMRYAHVELESKRRAVEMVGDHEPETQPEAATAAEEAAPLHSNMAANRESRGSAELY